MPEQFKARLLGWLNIDQSHCKRLALGTDQSIGHGKAAHDVMPGLFQTRLKSCLPG
jgi:hypothetical protein